MYRPLVLPSRNLFDMFLCSLCAYIITKVTFPPDTPPPIFPYIFGSKKDDECEDC